MRQEANILENDDRLVDTVQAAEILCVTPQTLRHWRCLGCGPAYVRLGRRTIRYQVSELSRVVQKGLRASTKD